MDQHKLVIVSKIIRIKEINWVVFFRIEFLAKNYTLIVSTTKNNYLAILEQADNTQISANPNDGPVPLVGAVTMYPELVQTVR